MAVSISNPDAGVVALEALDAGAAKEIVFSAFGTQDVQGLRSARRVPLPVVMRRPAGQAITPSRAVSAKMPRETEEMVRGRGSVMLIVL